MRRNKSLIFGIFLLIVFSGIVSASYRVSNYQFVRPGVSSSFLDSGVSSNVNFNSKMCRNGQDFIIRIVPGGCTPPVVRSDLLEEQNVPVYCQLQALKVNPLITVSSINSISFGANYPKGISTVAFIPNYPALGLDRKLSNGMWNNIGYAVIFLKRNRNESSMPKSITGGLSARIKYTLKDSFGLKNYQFYLPIMSDADYKERQGQYAFFNHMGYLRADDVQVDSASISIYSALNANFIGGNNGVRKQKLLSYNLNVGEKSPNFFLPGFGCLASSYLRLDSVEGKDTIAVLKVNSETFEVKKGEYFYDKKCRVVSDPVREGLRQSVELSCEGDEGRKTFSLRIEPKITLKIDGNERSYQVGDPLYTLLDKTIYLGYVGTNPNAGVDSLSNSLIYLVAVPTKFILTSSGEPKDKLDLDTLSKVAKIAENKLRNDKNIGDIAKTIFGKISHVYDWLFKGENFERINYGDSYDVFGKKVQIESFAVGTNLNLRNKTLLSYKRNAVEDYKKIQDNFANEKYPENSPNVLGEKSLAQLVNLSDILNQKEDLKKYCDLFKSKYSKSSLDVSPCEGVPKYSNVGVSTQTILMGGNYNEISFEGVRNPSFEDYGIELNIRRGDKVLQSPLKMGKGDVIYLDSLFEGNDKKNKDFIKLVGIRDGKSAVLKFGLKNRNTISKVGAFLGSENGLLNLNEPSNIEGTDYTFVLRKVNLKKVAKVSVHTSFRDQSKINFNFTLGIEKRAIQLSPEETKSRIKSWKNRINVLKGISNSLGKVIKGFNTACEATGAILTLKNLIINSGTKSVARKTIMNGEGGWNSKCEGLKVGEKLYSTKEQCLFDNSEDIDRQVKQVSEELDNQNKELKKIQGIEGVTTSGGIFGQDMVNQNALMEKGYSSKVKDSLGSNAVLVNPEDKTQSIDINKIKEILTGKNFGKIYSLGDAKKIELYANLISKYPEDSTYKKRLFTLLNGVEKNADKFLIKIKADEKAKEDGLKGATVRIRGNKNAIKEIYDGAKAPEDFGDIPKGSLVQPIVYGNVFYYLTLKETSSGEYYVNEVYDKNKIKIEKDVANVVKSRYSSFKKIDKSENTQIKNPEIKYYETDPYKGLPSLVPIDSKNGWYAYIPQIVSASSSSGSYDLSARINSFWICNAGVDGIMEYKPMNDECQLINLGNSNTYSNIGSLSGNDAVKLVNKAVNNIRLASNAYKNGVKEVNLGGERFNVGSPAIDTPTIECTDIMSPSDCKILFNACDPVICPSSRCDFGGEYPVRNVIQSGIFGSIALCLPNWNEGIKVPICVTGVKAGVDNFVSVADSYVKCLNTSLNTGETTGICDEINSIYMCEFIWKQALPIVNLAVPKIDNLIFGGGAKGGGEYVGGIQGALKNAKNSADYLVQYYSVNANSAFKARSQKEVGGFVCKNFLSVVYPQGQGALEMLTQSKSPPQFTAKFDVIPFSSVTYPPQSHYKVFYHIFAGNDQGAYYRVYMRGDGSSYFRDASLSRPVDSGYIPPGEYKTNTIDFTADKGYKQLCVQVNNQEECGFGTVSTNFAVNYLGDQYIKDQASLKNITSQKECTSGSPNLLSLLNPNLEAGVTNAISPDLASEGITRVCATKNPGSKNDVNYPGPDQRWVNVGYCNNVNIRCWIDKQSIVSPDVFNFQTSANQTLQSLGDLLKKNLVKQKGLLNNDQFVSKLNELDKETAPLKKIDLIERIYDKVLESNKKAYLLFLRGGIYQNLAVKLFRKLGLNKISDNKISQSIFSKLLVRDLGVGGILERGKSSIKIAKIIKDGIKIKLFSSIGEKELFRGKLGDSIKSKGYELVNPDIDFSGSSFEKVLGGTLARKGVYKENGNSLFVDNIYNKGFLTKEQYLTIRGENWDSGWSFLNKGINLLNGEENMDEVAKYLVQNKINERLSRIKISDLKKGDVLFKKGERFVIDRFVKTNKGPIAIYQKDKDKYFQVANENNNLLELGFIQYLDSKDIKNYKKVKIKDLRKGDIVMNEKGDLAILPIDKGIYGLNNYEKNILDYPQIIYYKRVLIPKKEGLTKNSLFNLKNPEIQKLKKSKNSIISNLEIGGAFVIDGEVKVVENSVENPSSGIITFIDSKGQEIVRGTRNELVKGIDYYISVSDVERLSNIKVSSLVGKDLSFSLMMDSEGNVFIPKEVLLAPPIGGSGYYFINSKSKNAVLKIYNLKSSLLEAGIIYYHNFASDLRKRLNINELKIGDKLKDGIDFITISKVKIKGNDVVVYSSDDNLFLDESGSKKLIDLGYTGYVYPKGNNNLQSVSQIILENNCKKYYSDIKTIANKDGVDPYLVLAVMYQESKCVPTADSGSSLGLMQININFWCGKKGLPSDKEKCKKVLIENPTKNIEVGVQILSDYYKSDSEIIYFTGCNVQNVEYKGWDAALRRYNGFKGDNIKTCNENYPSQDYYVENVTKNFNSLKNLKVFENYEVGKSCPFVQVPDTISKLNTSQKKILQATSNLEDVIVDSSKLRDISDGGGINCYSAVANVYLNAGLDLTKDLKRIYAAGKNAVLSDGTKLGDITPFLGNEKNSGLSEEQKLNLLSPGFKIDIAYKRGRSWKTHTVIFISWIDESAERAKIFDWNGFKINKGESDKNGKICSKGMFYPGTKECKIYRYNEISLKNKDNFVYHIRSFNQKVS